MKNDKEKFKSDLKRRMYQWTFLADKRFLTEILNGLVEISNILGKSLITLKKK